MFDHTIILGSGRAVYSGPREQMTDYFSRLDFTCPPSYNPADYIMFVLQQQTKDKTEEMAAAWQRHSAIEEDPCHQKPGGSKTISATDEPSYSPLEESTGKGFCIELWELMVREFRNTYRTTNTLAARFGGAVFMGLLVGIIFKGAGRGDDVMTHFGVLNMLATNAMFSSLVDVTKFPDERSVFLREYASDVYGVLPYFLSKTAIEIPIVYLSSWLLVGIAYPLCQLRANIHTLVLACWVLALESSSLGLIIGCLASNTQTAIALIPFVFVPHILFAGFYIKMEQIPSYMRWIQHICGLKYAINIMAAVEFHGISDDVGFVDSMGRNIGLLEQNQIEYSKIGQYFGILIACMVGFRAIAVLALRAKATRFD